MILYNLHALTYCLVAIFTLTWLGNIVCQILFQITGMKSAGRVSDGVDRAGHLIGWLERLIIAAGILCHSWEIVAAVIALKTIGRFKELDDTVPAEYFLVGSLFSVLWAFVICGLWLAYDHGIGLDLRKKSAEMINPAGNDAGAKPMRVSISLPRLTPVASDTRPQAIGCMHEEAKHSKDRYRGSENPRPNAARSGKAQPGRTCMPVAPSDRVARPAKAADMY